MGITDWITRLGVKGLTSSLLMLYTDVAGEVELGKKELEKWQLAYNLNPPMTLAKRARFALEKVLQEKEFWSKNPTPLEVIQTIVLMDATLGIEESLTSKNKQNILRGINEGLSEFMQKFPQRSFLLSAHSLGD